MYNEVQSSIRICKGATKDFLITICLHQGYALSSLKFVDVLDQNKNFLGEILWCMFLADDIVFSG